MKKILIINLFGIGDVLFSTPLLRALKLKYPDASITYVCNRRTEGLLKNDPNLASIHTFEKDEYRVLWNESKIKCIKKISSLIKRIGGSRYDILIDMSLGYIYSLMLAIFGSIPVRVGFNYRNRGRFLTHKVDIKAFDKEHVIEYYLELGKVLGIDTASKEMCIAITKEDALWAREFLNSNGIREDENICGIVPGCGASWGKDAKYRRWSTWKFAEVANHAAGRYGHKILIFGASKEKPICSKMQSEMKVQSVQACGKTTLGQLAALLDRCALVVTNDGGPLHMSVALKKKTVSIFGPVDEKVYGPYPSSDRFITISSGEPCRPCYKNFKYVKCEELNCLKHIGPDKVIAAVDMLMGRKV